MKKIFYLYVFLLVSTQSFSQQYINLYQDDVVVKQFSTEEIDSVTIAENEPRIISFWHEGEVLQTYNSVEIDSVKVTSQGGKPFSYIGIVGFNSSLEKKFGALSPSTASAYKSFINNLWHADGTILYYAVDSAMDMLDEANIETPLNSVNVITFTDGLDQGSLMMTDKYNTSSDYLNALRERIKQTKKSELPFNFYSVGLRGNDVSNILLFKEILRSLASSEENAFELTNISELRSKLQDIAKQIISVSIRQTVSVRVPGIDSGTRMRFVFDGKSAERSELYIEGTFDRQDLSLHDVTYHGITATSGKTVQGTQDGIFVTYTFTGMCCETGTELIPSRIRHYYYDSSAARWQNNSEFSPDYSTQRNVSHNGTCILLILDSSSSLGSDFSRMQQYANEFIDLIAGNAEPFELKEAPRNIQAEKDENDLAINVTWDAVKYAQSYDIIRSDNSNYSGNSNYYNNPNDHFRLVAKGVKSNTWKDENPLEDTNYYKVRAVGYGFATSYSEQSAREYISKLDSPKNVQTELGVKEDKIIVKVSWDDVKFAQSYNVYRNSSSNGTYTLVAEGVTSNSWTDESPLESYISYYKVSAINKNVTGFQSAYASMNMQLSAPENIKAVLDVTKNTVSVTWGAVKFAESYTIYRSGSSSGTYEKVAEGVKTVSWTDESPLSDTNYYKVAAFGYGLHSPQSSVGAVRVREPLPNNGVITVNGVSFKMIKVSGGTFQMGKSADGNDWTPVHNVTLSDYYIGETEVTEELWKAVTSNSCFIEFRGEKFPASPLVWSDCVMFIATLNSLTGLKFRVPTEAEWEFAAKGGTQSKNYIYSGSNIIDEVSWNTKNEVATKAPNELGIYGMSGTVSEWCQDYYDSYPSSPQIDPTGPSPGTGPSWGYKHVIRNTSPRVVSRGYSVVTTKAGGLRLAL